MSWFYFSNATYHSVVKLPKSKYAHVLHHDFELKVLHVSTIQASIVNRRLNTT